jgi:hypothetical protein
MIQYETIFRDVYLTKSLFKDYIGVNVDKYPIKKEKKLLKFMHTIHSKVLIKLN